MTSVNIGESFLKRAGIKLNVIKDECAGDTSACSELMVIDIGNDERVQIINNEVNCNKNRNLLEFVTIITEVVSALISRKLNVK